ncbi:MAG: TatD family deoxyribonuclease [Ruminococcaceae bacterium]|nr:TatD family deoxyribonuclease [Oscillospiraceae bacterium]
MIQLFDSHAHYDDSRFAREFEGGGDGAILKAREEGVIGIINVGSSLKNSRNSVALSEKYSFIKAAAGLHPHDAQFIEKGMEAAALDEIMSLLRHPNTVALGEIGLDYHYDDTDEGVQKKFFDAQLSMAEETKMPVIIHDRDAHGDIFDMISCHKNVTGVFHSFSGSAEMARQLINKGWYISFSGPITYKNAVKVREAASVCPRDRVLVETDAPYLPPVPHRGEINYSGYLHYTAEGLASAMNLTIEEIAAQTIENTCRLFGITEWE